MRPPRAIPAASAFLLAVALAGLALPASATVPNEEKARVLARQNNCFKCHAVAKKKDGPAWKDVALKYKGKPGAEDRLVKHITTGEKAKFPDGHEEDHVIIKTKDQAQIRNLVAWILSL